MKGEKERTWTIAEELRHGAIPKPPMIRTAGLSPFETAAAEVDGRLPFSAFPAASVILCAGITKGSDQCNRTKTGRRKNIQIIAMGRIRLILERSTIGVVSYSDAVRIRAQCQGYNGIVV